MVNVHTMNILVMITTMTHLTKRKMRTTLVLRFAGGIHQSISLKLNHPLFRITFPSQKVLKRVLAILLHISICKSSLSGTLLKPKIGSLNTKIFLLLGSTTLGYSDLLNLKFEHFWISFECAETGPIQFLNPCFLLFNKN